MALKDIADRLVAHCRAGTEAEGLATLYSDDATSAEAASDPKGDTPRVVKGLDAIRGKHAWWNENFIVHDAKVEGPFLHGDDRFAVIFEMDAEEKASGMRWEMKEVAIYTVKDDRIVGEEFYYTMEGAG
ncbi:MAG: SnoaL-like domain-containing protein [Rubricella sp.]